MASFASLTGQSLSKDVHPIVSINLNALLGKSKTGQGMACGTCRNGLSIIKGDWKFIEPGPGAKIHVNTNTETGNDPDSAAI